MSRWKNLVARWGSGAGEIDDVRIDPSTNSIQVVDYEHHEIHGGDHYFYCDYALNQSGSAVIDFIFVSPDTDKNPHLTFSMGASEGATMELYKGASGITGGTSITPVNNNGNSANTSAVVLTKDPSAITSDGTRAAGYVAGGGRTAGAVSRSNEIVLDRNATYLVRISSLATSNDIGWRAEWYEHTAKH